MANETVSKDVTPEKGESSSTPPMPERPFAPGKMAKWLEQSGLDKEPEVPVAKKETTPPEPAAGTKSPEPEKPYKVIDVNGKQVSFKNEEEVLNLARKALENEHAGEDRTGVKESLDRLIVALEGKKTAEPTEEQNVLGDLDLDLIDPALAKLLKDQQGEIGKFKKVIDRFQSVEQDAKIKQMTTEVETIIAEKRKEFPFEDFKDPTLGRNVTQDVYTGMVSVLVNEDVMQGREQRPLQEYLRDAARIVSSYQNSVRGGPDGLTTTAIQEKYPDAAKEIGELAVAKYLKDQEESGSPVPRDTRAEPTPRKASNQVKSRGISDMLKAAMADPEIEADIARAGKATRAAGS